MRKNHPSADTIERFAMNALVGKELDSFQEHIMLCPACQSTLEDTYDFVASVRQGFQAMESKRAA